MIINIVESYENYNLFWENYIKDLFNTIIDWKKD